MFDCFQRFKRHACLSFSCLLFQIGISYGTKVFHMYQEAENSLFECCRSSENTDLLNTVFDRSLGFSDSCKEAITAVSMLFYFGMLSTSLFVAFAKRIIASDETQLNSILTRRLGFLASILRLTGSHLKQTAPDEFKLLYRMLDDMLDKLKDTDNSKTYIICFLVQNRCLSHLYHSCCA